MSTTGDCSTTAGMSSRRDTIESLAKRDYGDVRCLKRPERSRGPEGAVVVVANDVKNVERVEEMVGESRNAPMGLGLRGEHR